MNRIILLLLVLAASATGASAQSQIAMLSRNGAVVPYYGFEALSQALADCQDGDVITLSPGMFKSANISKSITLRGYSAWEEDRQTILVDGFYVSASEGNPKVQIEGVRGTVMTLSASGFELDVKKCYFEEVRNSSDNNKVSISNCELFSWQLSGKNCIYKVSNSVIKHASTRGGIGAANCSTTLVNCCLSAQPGQCGATNATLTNCVMTNMDFDRSNTYINCLSQKALPGYTVNCVVAQNGESPYNDEGFYELKEPYAGIVGNDGTQIGIYGGFMPWNWSPAQPRITKFEVARQTDSEGKLAVEIEVESSN